MSHPKIRTAAEYLEDEIELEALDLDDDVDPETLEDETQFEQIAVRSSYRAAVMSVADEG